MGVLSGWDLAVFVRIAPGLPQILKILSGLPYLGIFEHNFVRIADSARKKMPTGQKTTLQASGRPKNEQKLTRFC
jgi:hypothetical protein